MQMKMKLAVISAAVILAACGNSPDHNGILQLVGHLAGKLKPILTGNGFSALCREELNLAGKRSFFPRGVPKNHHLIGVASESLPQVSPVVDFITGCVNTGGQIQAS